MTDPKPFGDFLAENPDLPKPRRGGRPCTTCQIAHVETLDAACHDLARRRALPADDPEASSMPWTQFFRVYVCTQFPGFKPSDPRTFFRHVDNCLGIQR